MSNFLQFIEEDTEAKKTLFLTLPSETKGEIKKYNEKLDSVLEKYNEYQKGVKKYLDAKSKSFSVKETDKGVDALASKVNKLEHVKFILNPLNSYFEKLGFDTLFFEIGNHYDFNFNSLNENINKFLDKFELVGIKLIKEEFNYTCYVNEYMSALLDVRIKKSNSYDKVSEIFENVYWVNPEIISHIELNFRKLIRKYERTFVNYISKHQKEIMVENKITSYQDCLNKLKAAYLEMEKVDKESIYDVVELAKSGTIDINNYFEGNKVRLTTYSSLMIEQIPFEDKNLMDKFYESLERLKDNVIEFENYSKFLPIINGFKADYEKQIQTPSVNPKDRAKALKNTLNQINDKESKLEKLNKKIFSVNSGFLDFKENINLRQLKIESVGIAKSLYDLYKTYEQGCFNEKVLSILNKSLTISDLLHLYYSFDYFKKVAIKKYFEITSYSDITKYSEEFDLFAMNPTNIVIDGVLLFEENNLAKVIMNRYRLDNINLTEELLNPDDLELLIGKIDLLLRIKIIEESDSSVEKIWFITQVNKISPKETPK